MIVNPPTTLVIGIEHNGVRMSPEQFDALPDWDELYNYELIHGVLVVNPPPSIEERDPNEELGRWLRNYQEYHPSGSALDATVSENSVYLSDSRRRVEMVGMTLDVTTPKRQLRLVDEMPFRMYTAAQFRKLLSRVPELELAETYDFDHNIDRPIKVHKNSEDVVFVLQKR